MMLRNKHREIYAHLFPMVQALVVILQCRYAFPRALYVIGIRVDDVASQ